MMLQILGLVLVAAYFALILTLLKKRKFILTYSLLWLFAGVVMLVIAIFPQLLGIVAGFLGFEVASNGLFALCILLIIMILVSITAAITAFSGRIRRLVQTQALLEKRVRELEAKLNDGGDK